MSEALPIRALTLRRFASLMTLGMFALLAACAVVPPAPPPAPPPPPPAPPPPPPPPPVAAAPERPWDVAPLTPGDWTYRRDPQGPVATFGLPGAAVLDVRCRAATREIAVSRLGAGGQPGMMTIRTSAGDLAWPTALSPDGSGRLVAVRLATDRGFDWIGFSRGRFSVELPGLPRLIVPAWAEISRVVEDCRG